jgi:hypothetical protein
MNVFFKFTKASWNQEFNFLKGTIFRFAVQFKKQSLLFENFLKDKRDVWCVSLNKNTNNFKYVSQKFNLNFSWLN